MSMKIFFASLRLSANKKALISRKDAKTLSAWGMA
jgi:hypothetical protein